MYLVFILISLFSAVSHAALSSPTISGSTGSSLAPTPAPDTSSSAKDAAYEASVIRAKQTEVAFTSNCQELLNKARYAALGNQRKADCDMAAKHPECKTTCKPIEAPKAETPKPLQDVDADLFKRSPTPAPTPNPTPARARPPIRRAQPAAKPAAEPEEEEEADSESTPTPAKKKTAAKADPTESESEAESEELKRKTQSEASPTPDAGPTAEETATLSKCRSLATQADSACQYHDDEDYGAASSSIAGSCEQMQSAGIKSGNAKNDAAKACSSAWSECANTCKEAADKYEDSENWSVFNGQFNTCLNLSRKVSELTTASNQSAQASTAGTACDSASSQSPQSAGGEAAEAARQAAEARDATCAAAPASAECAQQSQYAAARAAVAGFNEAETSRGSFDTADTSGLDVTSPIIGSSGADGAAIKNGTIANNTGGGIPVGGGGAGAKTATGIMGAVQAATGATDLEMSVAAGGYSALLNGEFPWSNKEVSEQIVDRALASLGHPVIDPDLKRYLPGGDLYKKRNGPADIVQFHAAGVDIFQRIHDRYTEKCLLGELFECR